MRFTNHNNLPSPLVKALTYDDYSQDGDISATGLIMPPQMRQLQIRYADEITEDISDRIWIFLGNVHHRILELAKIGNALQEERLSCMVNGWKVTGQCDLYEPPATLSDYKVTSVYSIIFGLKTEWQQQLNIYKYLFNKTGFAVRKLQIVAILRDWSKTRASRESSYPQSAVQVLDVPIWSENEAETYLRNRVTIHQMSEKLPDESLPECTPEERWEKPTIYAVMKNKNKRSVTNHEDPLKSKQRMEQLKIKSPKDDYWIEIRTGESTRCEHYCNVQKYCHQYKNKIKEEE